MATNLCLKFLEFGAMTTIVGKGDDNKTPLTNFSTKLLKYDKPIMNMTSLHLISVSGALILSPLVYLILVVWLFQYFLISYLIILTILWDYWFLLPGSYETSISIYSGVLLSLYLWVVVCVIDCCLSNLCYSVLVL